jgi:hypothetical protein
MPLAALTPVLNDLLNKDGGSSSAYPQHSSQQINDTSTDYLRKSSSIPNQVSRSSSIDDVSISFLLIIFILGTRVIDKTIYS